MGDEELILKDDIPTKKLKFIKEDSQMEILSDDQIKQVLNFYKRFNYRFNSFTAYRNHQIFIFMLSTGCRRGELKHLKWQDVDFNSQVISLYGKKRQVASIPITLKLKKELAEYYLFLKDYFKGEPEYVFSTGFNTQLSDEAISTMFKKLKKDIGFKISPVMVRRTFCHRSLRNGMDVLTLQKIMRHETLQMTQRYANIWGTALASENDKHNTLNSIDI